MKVYYKDYLIESEYIKKFDSNIIWIYGRSVLSGNWIVINNNCKSIKEAKTYIRDNLKIVESLRYW